jgi:hypothetical protein
MRMSDEYAGKGGAVNLIESVLVAWAALPIDCGFPFVLSRS